MSLTELNENLNTHQSLPDKPALPASELKKAFDDAPNKIKEYINSILTKELDRSILALQTTSQELQAAVQKNADVLSIKQLDIIYPIGSIYMSINDNEPSGLFGGTWEKIKDKFLLSSGDTYEAGTTGGEATHKLTADESGVPEHSHGLNDHTHSPSSGTDYGFVGYKTGEVTRTKVNISNGTRYAVLGAPSASSADESGFVFNNLTEGADGDTTKNTGTEAIKEHNNMPPYLTVYMWKRIA